MSKGILVLVALFLPCFVKATTEKGYKGVEWGSSPQIITQKFARPKSEVGENCSKLSEPGGILLDDRIVEFFKKQGLMPGLNLGVQNQWNGYTNLEYKKLFSGKQINNGCALFFKNGLVAVLLSPSSLTNAEVKAKLIENYGEFTDVKSGGTLGWVSNISFKETDDTVIVFFSGKLKSNDRPGVYYFMKDQSKLKAAYEEVDRNSKDKLEKSKNSGKKKELDSL